MQLTLGFFSALLSSLGVMSNFIIVGITNNKLIVLSIVINPWAMMEFAIKNAQNPLIDNMPKANPDAGVG